VPDAIVAPAIDETVLKGEEPRPHALRLACAKAQAVARQHPDAMILAADTVVVAGRRILPKAADEADVRRCLGLLSGRRHQVMTAVALCLPGGRLRSRVALTRVSFLRLTEQDIDAYAACGEGVGKAGGYAIQGRAEMFVSAINGSWSNVVGLPLAVVRGLLGGGA